MVINVRFDMDRAEAVYGDLGFTLTSRGYHSMGSINHLMMFGDDYMELIGIPTGTDSQNISILDMPLGINGLVFKTSDVDADYARLQMLGMDGEPPAAFTRPVSLPDGKFPARFRTVTVRPDVFPAGRVYFCEHGTPELVWRSEWQSHANGSSAIREIIVVSEQFNVEAENFATLLETEVTQDGEGLGVQLSGSRITLLPPASYQKRYGDLASPMADRRSIFGSVIIQVEQLEAVRKVIKSSNTPPKFTDEPNRVVVRDKSFDVVLDFIEK
ncbi:MAG: VOC family protein [SAR324 cluster bacterium]|nr:VOC family protein [SAR324 cluster bacterium]